MSGQRPTVVVCGYASVDYAMRLAPFEGPNATTIVRSRADEWPRYGGVAHVTRAVSDVAADRADVVALSWVGADAEGEAWRAAVRDGGASVAGVAVSGTRSPSSHLLYPEGSSTICLFDPADCHPAELTETQQRVIAGADVAVITVGPTELTRAAVKALPADRAIVWIVKHDPSALSPELVAELADRSRLITLSSEESSYLDAIGQSARPGTYVARTAGAEGADLFVVVAGGSLDHVGHVATERVTGVDTTGAGDTFAGALAVSLAANPHPNASEMLHHMTAAVEAATNMLVARAGAAADEPDPQHQREKSR